MTEVSTRKTADRQYVRTTKPVAITYADLGNTIHICDVNDDEFLIQLNYGISTAFNNSAGVDLDVGDDAGATSIKDGQSLASAANGVIGGPLTQYDGVDTIYATVNSAGTASTAGSMLISATLGTYGRTDETYNEESH